MDDQTDSQMLERQPGGTALDAFKKHGLVGLITGAHLLLIFYLVSTFNKTLQDTTSALNRLTSAIENARNIR